MSGSLRGVMYDSTTIHDYEALSPIIAPTQPQEFHLIASAGHCCGPGSFSTCGRVKFRDLGHCSPISSCAEVSG